MSLNISKMFKPFFILVLLTSIGIFIHELCHHLFGVHSFVSLSRNYPLERITNNNMNKAIFGTLAGPIANLLLGYIGFAIYRFFSTKRIGSFGFYLGVSNCFLALSGAVINLIVDLISGNMGNDLEQVSSILGLSILILPIAFSILSFIPLVVFSNDYQKVAPNKVSFGITIFVAWLLGGSLLMMLDSIFSIRFSLI